MRCCRHKNKHSMKLFFMETRIEAKREVYYGDQNRRDSAKIADDDTDLKITRFPFRHGLQFLG